MAWSANGFHVRHAVGASISQRLDVINLSGWSSPAGAPAGLAQVSITLQHRFTLASPRSATAPALALAAFIPTHGHVFVVGAVAVTLCGLA